MFKIESYITPVILSYVEKYVKNFKPEQSQVSLWGGDASFQNLDLRLEVLEEQLNLPFTFVSGHIHELIIHVPWVKITSEPIVVTINTIECILNLKDRGQVERSTSMHQGAGLKAIQEESPPGYIKSIVTKVINNITINCNNLILKYVEEDIVLSVNVRFLSMQTVNESWEPTFMDVSSSDAALRKIVIVEDLTLCLDKMDTAGKIEIYQDPVLYRCSMVIRLMMNYNSTLAKCASLTRFDLHCEKMEFSMTEQQLPMLLRLITLINSLQTKPPGARSDKPAHSSEERGDVLQEDEDQVHGSSNDAPSWSGWAWNTVTSFLPVNWDPDWSGEQQVAATGHTIHMGVYVDEAALTFKTVETLQEQLFYKARKIRYNSFLALRVTSAVMSMLIKGVSMSNLQFGLGSIRLQPQGICSCGYQEVVDEMQPPIYIEAGTTRNDYLKDSLFDENVGENTHWKNHYSDYDIDYHLRTVQVTTMLDRSPAFGMDIVRTIDIPDDFPEERLPEFESNFEYSNFPERKITRYVLGDLKIQICTGLMHRINAVKSAAKYDHSLYITKKAEPSFDELPPVTVEEYEALRENVSMTETYFNFYRLGVQLQLTDHSLMKNSNPKIVPESRFSSPNSARSENAHLSVEFSEITGSIVEPMYPFRLASCASQQPEIDPDMLNDCYSILDFKISGLQSQLYLNRNCRTTIVMPCNAKCAKKTLVFSQYFRQSNVDHDSINCEIDDITFTGTKAKFLVAASIATSIVSPTENSNPLFSSSLLVDACSEKDPVYLELSLENVTGKRTKSSKTIFIELEVNSVKAFAINDTQQAFILSGPEIDANREKKDGALFTGILRYSESLGEDVKDPPILSFKMAEMRGSFDPLLCKWLKYQAVYEKPKEAYVARPGVETPAADETFSDTDVRKKIFRTLHESVHSLSDKEKKRSSSRTDWSKGITANDESVKKNTLNDDNEIEELQKNGFALKIAQLYPFWRKLVLCGSVGHFVLYIPLVTMDGIGVAGIESAKDRALTVDPNLNIFTIKSPTLIVHSANVQLDKFLPNLKQLSYLLPMTIRLPDYHSFPWTLKFSNFNCYTLKKSWQTNLIRSVDLTATIDVTTKAAVTEFVEGGHVGLGLCVYVDTSPIIISLSEEQITALNSVASDLLSLMALLQNCDEKMEETSVVETEATYIDVPKTPSSYNPVVYPENTTSPSSISTARNSSDQTETESPIITAMVQWTVTKMSLKVYTLDRENDKSMKLLLELEDIITTFDWQPIYLQVKNKITTATVCHFTRNRKSVNDKWALGDYAGLIMLGCESTAEKSEDTGFLSVTYTKAQSGNVHTRWGAQKHQKLQKIRMKRDCPLSVEGYITEIDMSLQRVDIILPPSIVNKFIVILKPFVGATSESKKTNEFETSRPLLRCDNFDNKSLPLIYLEFKGMNLMIPTLPEVNQKLDHNLLMIQLDGISITPSTENPICRTILRSDIYQLAAQSNILNIPGSTVEDRQYEINIRGICACTTTWLNYQQNVPKRISQSYLYTMNENPALEWNNLASNSNLEPQLSTSLLTSRIDIRVIIAPAIVLQPSKIICGGAFELTCLTDIDVAMNSDQMKLLWRIYTEINNLFSNFSGSSENFSISDNRPSLIITDPQEVSAPVSRERKPDFTGDSGIDFGSSSVNFVPARKISTRGTSMPLPLEILVNFGLVNISLNMISPLVQNEKNTNESANEEEATYEFPIFHIMLTEPNFYISQLNEKEKIQISCFDISVSLKNGSSQKLLLVETTSGSPHPNTGIPPSFVIFKCEKHQNSNNEFFVDVGRPTNINYSMTAIKHFLRIKQEIAASFNVEKVENFEEKMESTKIELPELSFMTKQLVLRLFTKSDPIVSLSVAKLFGNISRTPKTENIHGNLSLESLVISSMNSALKSKITVFLNPSSFQITANVFWETWQDPEEEPQIKVQAHSDNIYFNVEPQQLKILESVIQEYHACMEYLNIHSSKQDNKNYENSPSAEQYYKDDLKAGAFQFVNGNVEEMPLPYQVVFFTHPKKGMAWRYPQPRIITGLFVSPIPFEVSEEVDLEEEPIRCTLEYWSESHRSYRRYVDFHLSETENGQPELPKACTHQAVGSIWRVTISTREEINGEEDRGLAPQLLVGCLRVDSYFNALSIPNLQIALNLGNCEIFVSNEVMSSSYEKLPAPLSSFRLNGHMPETQCFLELSHERTSIVLNGWTNGAMLIDVSGDLSLSVLDYGLLHRQPVIERLESNIQICVADETYVSIECNPFSIKFGPSIAHTLAVSSNLWLNYFEPGNKYVAILTRIVVANDTNIPLRFGQTNSNDDFLVQTRECHFYCWRYPNNRTLRLAFDEHPLNWSQPLSLNKDGKQLVAFPNLTNSPIICAKIVSISATQKLVTFSGLLVLTNQLVETFQMKIVPLQDKSANKIYEEVFWINGNDRPASIALNNTRNIAIRLRFASSTNLSWTGDIPLKSNSKLGQPWLVKVPLQERGQFLSIWVRIVEEMMHGETRILVVMSPLYMIKSYLPVPVVIKIETPSLGMSSNATIKGQGKIQQLYCPGTFEHCHQLTFQFESSMPASNPYVPLSYSSVEERTFFARPRNEDIDAILEDLEKPEKNSFLPFRANHPNIHISPDQPQTHVQIKYRDAGLVSSTLLLELQPWCFIFNVLGCHIAIVAENLELCQIPHNGIITPPKLEGTFHLKITVKDKDYVSPAIQLARPDWNPGFYMPRIRGLVPVDGNIQASIECGSNICVASINSKMHEDMRIVRIMASHVICNLTPHPLRVACFAVSENCTGLEFPEDQSIESFEISPCKNRTEGIPIDQWRVVNDINTLEHEALYISLSRGFSWSCPVRVDKKLTARRCTAVSDETRGIPVVIITQEDEGTTYLLIHVDDHPQLYIENLCPFPIILGEANGDGGIFQESPHFSWRFQVQSEKSNYYCTPSTANKMPDCQTNDSLPKLRLCVMPSSRSEDPADNKDAMWSKPINMSQATSSRTEQYVRLPVYGDIKLLMEKRCNTICLRIVCMSQVEISAHDIRTRLILEEGKSSDVEALKSPWLDNRDRGRLSEFGSSSTVAGFSDPGSESDEGEQKYEEPNDSCLDWKIEEASGTVNVLRGSLSIYVRGINVIIMQDINENAERVQVASLCLSDLIILSTSNETSLTLCACVGDLQLDNQMFDQGGFDFPVVFMSQNPYTRRGSCSTANNRSKHSINEIEDQSLIVIDCAWEVNAPIYACKNVNIKIGPVSAYIEDTFVTQLLEYTTSTSPPCFNAQLDSSQETKVEFFRNVVTVPEHVFLEALNLRTPLRLQKLTIEPISVLLSVHTSIRLYVALDHSPLYFGAFEREHLITTPGGLASALTMHYISGALFGAGWMVSSLEILGSPGGFAQALGSGLKDFVTLPIQGILRGPWSFLMGITQGSASLMKHLTAGTVNSVTKLASSVARNLDRLTLDDEHLQRQEESRRTRPQGMAQGLYQGLTGFGMSLLGAVAGLAHHPLQQVLSGGATPRGLVTGVGLGIVGAVTKPLSGAAELVALTGQGLLEGTGWNPLPTPRQRPIVESVDDSNNSSLKCIWRLWPGLTKKAGPILHVTDAKLPICEGVERRIMLILTRQTLVVANIDESSAEKIYLLKEVTNAEHISDPTLLCLYCQQTQNSSERSPSPTEDPEMDQAMRVRVEQFVRGSSTGRTNFSGTYLQPEPIQGLQSNRNNVLTFYIEPTKRNYFLSLFEVAKRQDQGSDFIVL
ncbi:vacuolar protein sorting-associated protein 13B isoform X2 [Venturia canescens]|uniref:vacuolar protein sorting-associated protein 13B isoform X2 n=1 Tax=Venturia canescens TaxID=32260 RepID=UPI001C9BF57E|nr:vacuolar protein sorting-associated protein 13B isoform X2 [Venturia canescens]